MPKKATRRTDPVKSEPVLAGAVPASHTYEIRKPTTVEEASKDPTGIRGEINDWHQGLSRVTGMLVLAWGKRGFKRGEVVQSIATLRKVADGLEQVLNLGIDKKPIS